MVKWHNFCNICYGCSDSKIIDKFHSNVILILSVLCLITIPKSNSKKTALMISIVFWSMLDKSNKCFRQHFNHCSIDQKTFLNKSTITAQSIQNHKNNYLTCFKELTIALVFMCYMQAYNTVYYSMWLHKKFKELWCAHQTKKT